MSNHAIMVALSVLHLKCNMEFWDEIRDHYILNSESRSKPVYFCIYTDIKNQKITASLSIAVGKYHFLANLIYHGAFVGEM